MGNESKGGVDVVEHDWLDVTPETADALIAKEGKGTAELPVATPAAEPPKEVTPPPAAVTAPVAPATPAPPPAPAKVDPPAEAPKTEIDIVRLLREEREASDRRIQEVMEAHKAALQELAKKSEPQLSAEELQRRQEEARDRFLADPEAELKRRDAEVLTRVKAEAMDEAKKDMAKTLGYATVDDMETAQAGMAGVRTLLNAVDDAKKPVYPLMAEEAFRKEMAKEENLLSVFKSYPATAVKAEVLGSRPFWDALYNRVALAYTINLGKTPPAKEDDPLTPVTAAPAGTANPPAKTAGDSIWDEIVSAGDSGRLK